MERIKTLTAKVGDITIGGDSPIVVQTMCDTHTSDVEATLAQCIRLHDAGAQMVRITCPGLAEVENVKEVRRRLTESGIRMPIVADIHFSSATAIAVAPYVDKVRINPGNFNRDPDEARRQFSKLVQVCKDSGTAMRIGLNHGSLGERITSMYGNSPLGMAEAAMEWIGLALENDFRNVVVSLKSSNTCVMVEAYRLLVRKMQEAGTVFPLHVGVTEAGNGDSGRMKSLVGISSLLSDGIGDTVRVSLTEDPEAELPVAKYLAGRYGGGIYSSMKNLHISGRKASAVYEAPSRERLLEDFACDFGKRLLDKELDEVSMSGSYMDGEKSVSIEESGIGRYFEDELMQATRRRFYKPEYIACPGCGRTMYDLKETFEEVKRRTAHLHDVVIAVMGCIVNGPGEMADADWGYVGEGNHKVTIYHKKEPVLRHVPDTEAVSRLVALMESDGK